MKRILFIVAALIAMAVSVATPNVLSTALGPGTQIPPIIPADRNFAWNPGLMSAGGIPNRVTQCGSALSPIGSGTDDSTAIQTALDACTAGQFVKLNSGNFVVNNFVLVSKGITLRGAGRGSTILTKTNGVHGRYTTFVTGSSTIHTPEGPNSIGTFTGSITGTTLTITAVCDPTITASCTPVACNGSGLSCSPGITGSSGAWNVGDFVNGTGVTANTKIVSQNSNTVGTTCPASGNGGASVGSCGTYTVNNSQTVGSETLTLSYTYDAQPIIILGPARYPSADESSAQALTADGVAGATSVTIANAAGFAAGQVVVLDELTGASFQTGPVNFPCGDSATNASFTGSISTTTLTAGAPSTTGTSSAGFIYVGDILSLGTGPPTIGGQLTGTAGLAGTYSVSPSQTLGSTTVTSGGPCPPLVWKGDRVAWNMHWPVQVFQDDNFLSNSTDVADASSPVTVVNTPPCTFTWTGSFPPVNTKGVTLRGTTLPTGFSAGTIYYAVNVSGLNFQLATTIGGSALSCSSIGSTVTATTSPNLYQVFSRAGRMTNEMKEIASVSGNTINFTSPLSIGYRTSHVAQLTRYDATGSSSGANSVHVKNAGVESLTTVGGADGGIRFEACTYCWAKDVEVTQWLGEGIAVDSSFRVEIRDSYLHTGSWPQPGGAGYAISFSTDSAEALIENNIVVDTCKDIVMRASGTGTVVGYNLMDDAFDFDNLAWQEVGLNASHMAGPHHVLFEGNYSQNFDSDYTHGNAIDITVFRNVLTGQRRSFTNDAGNIRAAGAAYGSWNDSFIGNLLGRSGQMTGWHYTDAAMSCDASGGNCTGNNNGWQNSDIWLLGYDPERYAGNPDTQVLSTVIRDGNYDFLTNSQKWHNTPAGFTMPNSMYLTNAPAAFTSTTCQYSGSTAWPWSNPSTGTQTFLPAKSRYDCGTP